MSSLAQAVVVKPVLAVGTFLALRAFVNPLYANPMCAVRLVNESDARAYSVHPSWSGMSYDDSCAGDNLKQYRENQFSEVEGALQNNLTAMWNVVAAAVIVYQVWANMAWRGIGALVRGGFASLLLGYMGATVVLMHTHFEQDVTFMTGAIIHHAEESTPGINLVKATISEGYLICGFLNRAFYSFILYKIIKSDARLARSFNPYVIAALTNIGVWLAVTTVKTQHTIYHQKATKEMASAWPYTWESRAYKHVIVHHDTGESFSGDPFLDPVFDFQLHAFGKLHNDVFGLELNTPGHYAFSTIFDLVGGALCIAILFLYLHIGACLIPAQKADAKSKSA